MAITINGNGTLTGVSVGGLPDGIVDTDMLAASAVTAAKSSGLATTNGITMADSWRLTANFTGDQTPITSNWERHDTSPFETNMGTGLTESSGTFSFPSTGFYFITWTHYVFLNGDSPWNEMELRVTNNDSSYTSRHHAEAFLVASGGDTSYIKATESGILDITNISSQKFRFRVNVDNNSTVTVGNSTYKQTGFDIFRLGDT